MNAKELEKFRKALVLEVPAEPFVICRRILKQDGSPEVDLFKTQGGENVWKTADGLTLAEWEAQQGGQQ
jgi:hypothetical protein